MPSPILTTKLYIPPPRPDLVSRPRLFDCLQRGADSKLTLISAPAGYGKTTLLSEWISQSEIHYGWFSLDENDNDFERFLTYLVASLQSIPIAFEEDISVSSQTQESNIYEALLIPLINQISVQQGRFALVLDDYHMVQNQEIHQALNYLLEYLPANLHLVITTRTDPPLRLAQLRSRGELCEIRAEDLRFTTEEAIHFLNQSKGLNLTSFDIATLSEKTEGWITGLQLAAISLQGLQDKGAFIQAFAGDDRYIADYLLDEALSHQPRSIQIFLLQTSILDRLCAPLCNALTGQDDSQTILAEIERANLFLVPLDNQRIWFRYHHLFADLLKNRLRQISADDVSVYHKDASDWYKENGLFPDAINHALAVNDIKRIVQLTEEMAVYNMNHRESIALLAWLERLPEFAFRQHPWLLVARAWALFGTGEYASVEKNLVEVESILIEELITSELTKRIQGHIAAIWSILAELRGDECSVIQQAEDALELLPAEDVKLRAFVGIRWANCLVWYGEFDKAIQIYRELGESNKLAGDGQLAITALSEMAVVQMAVGKLRQAVENITELNNYAEMLAKRDGRRSPAMGILYRHISYIKLELNDLYEAEYYAREAVKICQQWGEKEALLFGLLAFARVKFSQGDYQKVDQISHQFLQIAAQISPNAVEQFQNWVIYFQLLQGRLDQTHFWVHERDLSADDKFGFEQRFEYQNFTHFLILKGNYSQALKVNAALLKIVENMGDMIFLIQNKALQAIIYDKMDKPSEAMKAIKETLSLASSEGYVRTILNWGEPVIRLLYQAAQNGIYTEYCQRLIDEFDVQAPQTNRDAEGTSELVEPLSDREIEVLIHIAHGCTNQEIAQELVLSLYTVKSHARNIYGKLGVKNRTEAVARARLLGLLPQD